MKLKVIPIGGLGLIGMNITAFEYNDSIIIVDCGMAFPENDMLGIDVVIPDVTYLKDNIDKVKGMVFTHGHEDHIGALPYILRELNVPLYATKLTMGLIERKLTEHNLMRGTKRKVVRPGQSINLGEFRIEFIKTNHSIQDAVALAIYSPAGIVVHTGDFKVDYTPVFGDAIDLQRFAEIGKKGVLALMCDSTNAERPGFTASERTVGHTIDNLFAENKDHRIIIATFASNVDRVQQIINTAYKYGRKVVVEGRSMVNVIATASELGYLNIPDNTLIELEQMKNYPDNQMVLITTGSQGESMAALSRMAANVHKKVVIKPGDTVIFSSNPIPAISYPPPHTAPCIFEAYAPGDSTPLPAPARFLPCEAAGCVTHTSAPSQLPALRGTSAAHSSLPPRTYLPACRLRAPGSSRHPSSRTGAGPQTTPARTAAALPKYSSGS